MVTIAGRNRHNTCEIFDDSTPGYDSEGGVRVASNLTPEEVDQAKLLYNLFNELWGVCAVKGDPGTGKDLFGNYISYMIKTLFPWKRIMRDEKPRSLYGAYGGIFSDDVLREDLERMMEIAKSGPRTMAAGRQALEKAADDWIASKGEVMLKNSVLYLTEWWRYCYYRDPMNPMNTTMGGIHKQKRHLDTLIIGTTQLMKELDKTTCKPWVDWQVTCTRPDKVNRTLFVYWIQRVKYDARFDQFQLLGKPFRMPVDAGTPRSSLGDGRITLRRPTYAPENEEERVVLDMLRGGVCYYEDMLDLMDRDGDMHEDELLATLKQLKFHRNKRAIDYPCWFGLYNSKSPAQMTTNL